jgi:23S rRNA (uracil1939-C5)-methyltransferase
MEQELKAQRADALTTVTVEKLVYGGDGLARMDGQVVLMPYVLPDEIVRVQAGRSKNGVLRAAGVPEIIEASSRRTQPGCEYFGKCGGCQYQHAEYALQLEQKRNILLETLQRLGGIRFDREIPVMNGEPWQYRNRVQLHFSERHVGFHQLGSRHLCPIDHCPISSPLLNEVIGKLRDAVKRPEWPKFLRSLEVFTNEREIQLHILDSTRPVAARFFEWCASFLPQFAPGSIEYSAAGHVFRISRGSFFQVNRFLVDSLVEVALGDLRGKRAVDLYAGVGLFTLPLAQRFAAVQAVERGGPAYRDLEWNAREIGRDVHTVKSSAEEFLRNLPEKPDVIVADPPRAGLGKELTAELLRLKTSQVVVVSCDPTTLARDLKSLLGAYDIERMTLVDLFPQTFHFETVVGLRAK